MKRYQPVDVHKFMCDKLECNSEKVLNTLADMSPILLKENCVAEDSFKINCIA